MAEQYREVKEKDRVWKKKMAKRQEKEKVQYNMGTDIGMEHGFLTRACWHW